MLIKRRGGDLTVSAVREEHVKFDKNENEKGGRVLKPVRHTRGGNRQQPLLNFSSFGRHGFSSFSRFEQDVQYYYYLIQIEEEQYVQQPTTTFYIVNIRST